MSDFIRDSRGSVAVIFGVVAVVLVIAIGIAVDYSRAVTARQHLQAAVDAAVLAAAHGADDDEQKDIFDEFLATNAAPNSLFSVVPDSSVINEDDGKLTGTAQATVDTTFTKLISVDQLNVGAKAAVRLSETPAELTLVLDVSSSMIEEGRFEPMKDAAERFVTTIAKATGNLKNVEIAIVPFSSRINTGLANTSFLRKWKGQKAVPERWTNPGGYYSSSYTTYSWIDGINFAMYNGKNYYWMGCVEPRIDFAIHTGISTNPALDEGPPSSQKSLAQDYNDQSGKSFCPPPVLPLSGSVSELKSAIDKLTSQGTTRLDAGMLGGWYSLSPKWKNTWASGSDPDNYNSKTRKVIVFMTDGQMNTNDDKSSKVFDWVCEQGGDCNDYANSVLTDVCAAIKSKDITIYAVAYDEDADEQHIKACATSADYFFEASSSSGSDYIELVYEQIAKQILVDQLALVE